MTASARAFSTPLSSQKRGEIAILVECLDRRALFLARKEAVRLRCQEVANLFGHGAVGGIERCQRIRRGGLLGCGLLRRGRRIGGCAVGDRGRLLCRGCGRGGGLRRSLLGRRRGHRQGGRGRAHGHVGDLAVVLRHDGQRSGEDHRQSRARQDAVISWVVHENSPQGLVHAGRRQEAVRARHGGEPETSETAECQDGNGTDPDQEHRERAEIKVERKHTSCVHGGPPVGPPSPIKSPAKALRSLVALGVG